MAITPEQKLGTLMYDDASTFTDADLVFLESLDRDRLNVEGDWEPSPVDVARLTAIYDRVVGEG